MRITQGARIGIAGVCKEGGTIAEERALWRRARSKRLSFRILPLIPTTLR